ncbi:MAG: hypothetical protein LBR89_03975, partial [Holosporales bacterium]|nr:hypothetical protein [Holosporales bacterium]
PDHFLDLWQSLQSFIKHCSSHDVLNFCASYVDTHYIRTLGKILNKVKSILRLDDDKYTES